MLNLVVLGRTGSINFCPSSSPSPRLWASGTLQSLPSVGGHPAKFGSYSWYGRVHCTIFNYVPDINTFKWTTFLSTWSALVARHYSVRSWRLHWKMCVGGPKNLGAIGSLFWLCGWSPRNTSLPHVTVPNLVAPSRCEKLSIRTDMPHPQKMDSRVPPFGVA